MSDSRRSSEQKETRTTHIPALDGIRAIAILWVMLFHFCESDYSQGGRLLRLVGDVLELGWIGVMLFFALSGFLITGILLDSRDDPHFFRRFYARRTLRIFPLYYAVLLLLFALSGPLRMDWFHRGWVYLLYGQNYLTGSHDIPDSPYLRLRHFWTLAIEEQFYLVWPFLVYLVRDRRWLLGILGSLIAGAVALRQWGSAAGISHAVVRGWTPAMLDSLLMGAAAAVLLRSPARKTLLHGAPWLLATGTAGFLWLLRAEPTIDWATNRPIFVWGLLLLSVASAGMVLCAMREGSWIAQLCSLRVMRFLGKYSYGIYVLHYLVGRLGLPVRRFCATLLHSKAAGVAAQGILMSTFSVLLGYLSFHLFEKHFLRLKRYFEYNRTATPHWRDLELPPSRL